MYMEHHSNVHSTLAVTRETVTMTFAQPQKYNLTMLTIL